MKNKVKLFSVIPLLVCAVFPLLTLILFSFGYSVALINYEIFSAACALICIASAFLIDESNYNKLTKFFMALLPLIQLINTVIYVSKSKSVITAVFMAVCFISCAIISKKVFASDKAQITSVITSSILFIITVLISFVTVFFSNFSVNTVIKTVDSPNGTYYAEIVDSDQGATGGSTVVYAKKTDTLNLFVLEIEKNPERVYLGEWREYETMEIYWKDESCLIINGKEYSVTV